MGPQTQTVPIQSETQSPPWGSAKRIAFRFCFVYFGLFCLTTQVLGGLFPVPKLDLPDPATLTPVRQIVFWAAANFFHVKSGLVYSGSGSGDKTFDWVLIFCVLVCAAVSTAVWSFLDHKRTNYDRLNRWFRLFIRFALASEMLLYGMDKAVPLQMPFPFLTRLVEPYGNFSPMGVLWAFVGTSPPYEIFVGCAELLGGILLIVPRTTMLGALVCLADLIQVFLLNMSYDVPVKLFSFHLLLLSLFLLAPYLSRLLRFFLLHPVVDVSRESPLFRLRRANRVALALQVLFGLWLLAGNALGAWNNWYAFGGGRPKSALYGIWNVKEISSGDRSPVPSYDQWRRAIFDFPTSMTVQQQDEALVYYSATIDTKAKTLLVTSNGRLKSIGHFTFQRSDPRELALIGDMDGQRMQIQLELQDKSKLPLVNRSFHWIQEYPFNR